MSAPAAPPLTADALLERLEAALAFWLRHGLDQEHGGFLTALDHDGARVDADKAVWLQGRAAWLFAHLHRTHEARPEWLAAARSAAEFLLAHGFDERGRMPFLVARDGRPLRRRRYAYSELFAAMGFAELAAAEAAAEETPAASGSLELAARARDLAERFLAHDDEPERFPPKWELDTRPMRGLAKPMMALCLSQTLRDAGAWDRGRAVADEALAGIRAQLDPERRAVLEVVGRDGAFLPHFEGRSLNPGHALEAAWFVLEEARRRDGDETAALRRMGLDMAEWSWERGWDPEHGGILSFVSVDHRPIQEYGQDQKFWWPQCEALLAALHAAAAAGDERVSDRWRERAGRVWAWFADHHLDSAQDECFGWLDRAGRPIQTLKGSHWKGPFHYPRTLLFAARLLRERSPAGR